MNAQFKYVIENRYQDDAIVLAKLNGSTDSIISQSQIQYIVDYLDAIFVSSSSSVTNPNTITAVIEIQLSADFNNLYPTDADKNTMLKGTFQGIISAGLPAVNIIESIIYF